MTETTPAAGFRILAREDFSDVTYSLVVHHPLMAKAAQPGQFVIVMSHESGERIPLTIADFDRKKGTVTLSGHVRLTRGQNEMRGAYGVIDLNRNVGRLLPAPPGKHVALGGLRRVEGLIVPPKPATPAARAKTGAKRDTTVPSQP